MDTGTNYSAPESDQTKKKSLLSLHPIMTGQTGHFQQGVSRVSLLYGTHHWTSHMMR